MEKCPDCGSTKISGGEFRGGYDGVSMRECGACSSSFDRWSGLKIRKIYRPQQEEYTQPMFRLEDGSMSWYAERWFNPIHKTTYVNGLNKVFPKELQEKMDEFVNLYLNMKKKNA